uniref:Uncharacterized protein n=1 Tax=viral metagenome TaxID=1070528 RepID=A0A6C0H557_9ZZZZ
MSRELFLLKVNNWIKDDDEIERLEKELKRMKKEKKMIADEIMKLMDEKQLGVLNISDAKIQLQYDKKNVKKPLNRRHMENLLKEYFKENPENGEYLCNYLDNNREIVVVEKLKKKQLD